MSKTEYDIFVCYECEGNEVSAPVGTVHPLCELCEQGFDNWLEFQLSRINGAS